ncbi:NADP-dependent malic enzyme [bacterium]|nr:NADP-dependent malic enzyme [bacterium]
MSIETKSVYEQSVEMHRDNGGKLEVRSKVKIENRHDLSLAYTPGVARVCEEIAEDTEKVYSLTIKKNTVAVVSDGSAVLGLGNIGAHAAIPVMEGKAILFKEYADIDAFPICIQSQNTIELINIIKNIAPVFGGINLEDIASPRCFEIEMALQDIGIPVFHDDQHGTAIVVLAAVLNAAKVAGKKLSEMTVVINGGGAAGTAIAELLLCCGHDPLLPEEIKDILVCDSKGILYEDRPDIESLPDKMRLAKKTNRNGRTGRLADAMVGADVFLGVSVANSVPPEMIRTMAEKSIVLAMANPIPEIMPDIAKEAGAFIVGTGRSDFPNQVNNVLAFPGIFRGALDSRAKVITKNMKVAAALALANSITPSVDEILPSVLDKSVTMLVADAVAKAWHN